MKPITLGLAMCGSFCTYARPFGQDDLQNFRDDLPGLTDLYGIADADVLVGDKILIVERGRRHGRSRKMHRCDDGARRQDAGAPHLYDDILQDGLLDLRRVFEGRRPAREFCGPQGC